jgi:hypothetical protein
VQGIQLYVNDVAADPCPWLQCRAQHRGMTMTMTWLAWFSIRRFVCRACKYLPMYNRSFFFFGQMEHSPNSKAELNPNQTWPVQRAGMVYTMHGIIIERRQLSLLKWFPHVQGIQGLHAVPQMLCEKLRCLIDDERRQLGRFSYHGRCLI